MAATLENKFYEAAEIGNVTVFLELIRQDHLLLDRVLVKSRRYFVFRAWNWRIEGCNNTSNCSSNQPVREHHLVQNTTTKKEDWFMRKRDSLMVVASLMATMAFQAGLTPPGGLWQDSSVGTSGRDNNGTVNGSHDAGTSIIADRSQSYYTQYLVANTISFISSMSIILLLVIGMPLKRRFFIWLLTVIVWIAISSMALTYRISLLVFTPKSQQLDVTRVLEFGVMVWIGVMALLLMVHTIRLIEELVASLPYTRPVQGPGHQQYGGRASMNHGLGLAMF